MKNRTREQRRAHRIAQAIRIAICTVVCIVVATMMANAFAAEHQETAEEYLSSIGADQAQREHVMSLYETWD